MSAGLPGLRRAAGLALAIGLAQGVPACRYGVDPNGGLFHCATDADCGGGWHCLTSCHAAEFSPYCVANGGCDPCPSLSSDPGNCGACGHACPLGSTCLNGACAGTLLDGGLGDVGEDGGPLDGSVEAPDGGDGGPRDAGASDGGKDGGPLDGSVEAPDGGDGGPRDAGEDGGGPDGSADAGAGDGGASSTDAGSDAGAGDAG